MSEFTKIEGDALIDKYWDGKSNFLVRMYIYAQLGLAAINNAKYLVAGIITIYVILKFTNPLWMLAVGIISIPFLILIGRWQMHKANKIQEYANTTKGTVLGYQGWNVSIETLNTLKEISAKLDKLHGNSETKISS